MLEYGIGITLYVKITDKKRLPLCGLVQRYKGFMPNGAEV
jgi:hypothetical protein